MPTNMISESPKYRNRRVFVKKTKININPFDDSKKVCMDLTIDNNRLKKNGFYMHAYRKDGILMLGLSRESEYLQDSEADAKIVSVRQAIREMKFNDDEEYRLGVNYNLASVKDAWVLAFGSPIVKYTARYFGISGLIGIDAYNKRMNTLVSVTAEWLLELEQYNRQRIRNVLMRELKYKTSRDDETEAP